MKRTPPLSTDFIELPQVLLTPQQEQSWHSYVQSITFIDTRIEIMRKLLVQAQELWAAKVQYAGEEGADGRIKLYTSIQGAGIAAQGVAQRWKIEHEVAEGNDIAMMEAIIRRIMRRGDEVQQEAWAPVAERFSAMFDEQKEDSLMWFVKEYRFRRNEGWQKMEDWLRLGREAGGLQASENQTPAEPVDAIDQRRPDVDDAPDQSREGVYVDGSARDESFDQTPVDPRTGRPFDI